MDVHDPRPVAVKQTKLSFTAGVLTNAAGEVVLLQVIWKGLTTQIHVDIQHDKLLQHHRGGSHFQNTETFSALCQDIARRFTTLRQEKRAFDVVPVMILDQAANWNARTAPAASTKIENIDLHIRKLHKEGGMLRQNAKNSIKYRNCNFFR
eukprot:PhM_4_TR13916/c2_g1_i5/m.39951